MGTEKKKDKLHGKEEKIETLGNQIPDNDRDSKR